MKTIIGNKILINRIKINLLSPQKNDTNADKTAIPKKKSKVFEIIINKQKENKVM
tara:strand:+ start:382 stop:546 length:165 start_codon:yes stop_codon:yes gene_type:complete